MTPLPPHLKDHRSAADPGVVLALAAAARAGRLRRLRRLHGHVAGDTWLVDAHGVAAVHKQADRYEGPNEVLAYDLDRLLGLGVVPPTFMAADGGTVRLFVSGQEGGDLLDATPEALAAAAVFDIVAAHCDRHYGNWVIAGGSVYLIDNGKSTFADRGLRTPLVPDPFLQLMRRRPIPPPILARLRAVPKEQIVELAGRATDYYPRSIWRQSPSLATRQEQTWRRLQLLAESGTIRVPR